METKIAYQAANNGYQVIGYYVKNRDNGYRRLPFRVRAPQYHGFGYRLPIISYKIPVLSTAAAAAFLFISLVYGFKGFYDVFGYVNFEAFKQYTIFSGCMVMPE